MEPTQQNSAGAKHERPSLMHSAGAAAGAMKSAPPVRLLDAVERETMARAPSHRRSKRGWLLGGTGLAVAVIGWTWFNSDTSAGGHAPLSGNAVLAAASTPASAAAPVAAASLPATEAMALPAAASDAVLAVADAGSGAARIESMAAAGGDGLAAATPATEAASASSPTLPPTAAAALATSSLAERGSAARTDKTTAPTQLANNQDKVKPKTEARSDSKADARKGKTGTSSDRSLAANGSTANAKTRASAERSVAAAKAKPAAAAKTRRGHEADPDADVVAAIMASLDKRGAAPPAGAPQAAAAQQTRSGSSIAELVSRCNSLPDDEMLACRRRICDGYWGKAQACPGSLAPQASAHP